MTLPFPLRPLLLALGLAAALAASAVAPAAAQAVAVVVNGQAITDFDVANRQRLMVLTGNRGASRTTAVDELIEERLKLQQARRLGISVTDAQVDTAFSGIAQRARLTTETLTRALGQRGVNARTLRDRIRADIAWQQVVQQRAQGRMNIRDQDIVEALRRRGQDPDTIRTWEFNVAQVVVFGAGADRRRAAEGLRGQINGCATLRDRVRTVRDAASRDPVRRTAQDLSPQLRQILEATPVGRATSVQQGQNGWEFAVVCDRRQVPGREAASQEVRELMSQGFETESRRLLQEARERAVIERRR
jgi:peptidyl-prolyl cis-trans isomerase SurA